MRIDRISAQAFRGFPGVVHFSLSRGVTIIYAPNGSGKTSLSEAFEWTLYGEVARKIRSKTPGEFGQEFLRSVHADPSDETWAEVELLKDDGTILLLRREMKKGRDTILYANSKPIESIADVAMETGLSFRPCLGQSEIKAFIDTEPKERWKQISAILGLGEFETVRDRLRKIKTDTDKMPDVTRTREAARRALSPVSPAGLDPLGQEPASLLRSIVTELKLPEDAKWNDVFDIAEKKITTLLNLDKKPSSLDQLITGPEKIDTIDCEKEIEKINSGLEAHRAWHEANKKQKFVEIGLNLTHEPTCPYCEEDTLTPEKMSVLHKIIDEKEPEPPELNGQFAHSLAPFQMLKSSPVNTTVVGSLIDALSDDQELVRLLEALPEGQKKLSEQLMLLGTLARSYVAATRSGDATPIDEVEKIGLTVIESAQKLSRNYSTLRDDTQQLTEKILAKFKGLSPEERLALERLQAIKQLAGGKEDVLKAWDISKRQAELDRFIRDFEQAEKNAVQNYEKDLSDDVKDYLSQLSSSKALKFERFNIKPGVHRQAGLEATAYNVAVNPTSMFSEAQGNCLGLSLYFSQRVNRNPSWNSIILDDPVQSMDDGHKGNLITLLSKLASTHQIVVFTHDREFNNSLVTQFENTPGFLQYEINRTDKSPVPVIQEVLKRFEHLLDFAEICADGMSVQRETGFNTIRKAIEKLSKEIAKKHKITLKGDLKKHIEQLLNNPLSPTDEGTLQRIRHDCNPGSHDSSANTSAGVIKGFAVNLRDIHSRYLP